MSYPLRSSSSNLSPRAHQVLSWLRRLDTHSLFRQNIDQKWARTVILPSWVHSLVVLVALNILDIHVEEVSGVHWAAFGFGVELRGEYGAGFVDHALVEVLVFDVEEERGIITFVGAIIQIHEILLILSRQRWRINRIPMVLGRDMALSRRQIQGRDVMSTITVLELDGTSTSCKSKQLVAETNTHDWELGRFHQASQMVDCFLAMGWVTWAIGDEHAVEMVSHLMDGEVVWEDSNACSSSNQGTKNVLLDTAIDDCNVHVSCGRIDVKRSLGADFLDQIDLLGINESLVLISVVFLSNCDSSQ
jgi:hypothetical protein